MRKRKCNNLKHLLLKWILSFFHFYLVALSSGADGSILSVFLAHELSCERVDPNFKKRNSKCIGIKSNDQQKDHERIISVVETITWLKYGSVLTIRIFQTLNNFLIVSYHIRENNIIKMIATIENLKLEDF
ncbi:hypothetical protein RIR_jg27913.t1 [Rhizophagus irregularis DAOM 181602=DAOM 197198]|nr:hypothetical protein RIR_jg27913.t1 [Rhizophagus irregularis DAOM 181602=DAOM 197198]